METNTQSQSSHSDLEQRLQQAMGACNLAEHRYLQAEAQLQQARQQQKRSASRARLLGGFAIALVVGAISLSALKPAGADGGSGPTLASLQQEINGLQAQINKVIQKTRFMFSDGDKKTTTFTGCNVYIQSGSGSTDDGTSTGSGTLTGLGNLIIGYNAFRTDGTDGRPGSHNLILGDGNAYGSYGGLIAGSYNAIAGPYAVITGGYGNISNGLNSSVIGGSNNKAEGDYSSISGGQYNIANGNYASVSGGNTNTASGEWASVLGGAQNTASNFYTSVSGGYVNTASGLSASVSGGSDNLASGAWASVSGGGVNTASDLYTSASGGYNNTASGLFASVSGGSFNTASGSYSIVCGGLACSAGGNNPFGDYTAILGGNGSNVVNQYGHNP